MTTERARVRLPSGVDVSFHQDSESGLYVLREQDVAPIVEGNKEQFNNTDIFKRLKSAMWPVASIPFNVYMDLMRQGIVHFEGGRRVVDEVKLRRWLNDPDNRAFRTAPGRV